MTKTNPGTAKYTNGYKDRSGKGTILLNGESFLRTHWGCNCCDDGPSDEDIARADEVVNILNNHEILVEACNKCMEFFISERDFPEIKNALEAALSQLQEKI